MWAIIFSSFSKNKSGNQDATPDSNTARPRGDRGSVGHLRPGLVRAIGSNHRKSNRPERRSSSGRGDRCHQRSDERTEDDRHEWRGDLCPSVPCSRHLQGEDSQERRAVMKARVPLNVLHWLTVASFILTWGAAGASAGTFRAS